ncbi:MAG: hypothetical protein GY716_19600, partial [bacterium]|nr:hypothetical protein [bacterium]
DGEGETTIIDDDGWFTNGSADDFTIPGCVLLTPSSYNRAASAWRTSQLDLTQSFDKTFRFYHGNRVGNGGEGIVFALQNDDITALGASAGWLGYLDIQPSIGVKTDTHATVGDFISMVENGSLSSIASVLGFAFENGREELLRVIWNAEMKDLDVHWEGEEVLVYTKDL